MIEARGSSSAASAANAVVDGVRRLVNDTAADDCISMSMVSSGEYDVDKGLIFSFPARAQGDRIEVIDGFKLDAYAQEKVQAVLQELQQELQAVRDLKLI